MDDKKPLMSWTPREHIERACRLLEATDAKFDENGRAQGDWQRHGRMETALDVARIHLDLASAKADPEQMDEDANPWGDSEGTFVNPDNRAAWGMR